MSKPKYNAFKRPFLHYETDNPKDDIYIRLTKRLMMDKKFITLSNSAKVLYVYMRMWAYPKKQFNYTIGTSKLLMSKNTFLKCINELEKSGFINVLYRNKLSHQMNVYEFSDRWYKEVKWFEK